MDDMPPERFLFLLLQRYQRVRHVCDDINTANEDVVQVHPLLYVICNPIYYIIKI
jgi:hypothetical protein